MNDFPTCPRCQTALTLDPQAAETFRCESCNGCLLLLDPSPLQREILKDAAEVATVPQTEKPAVDCPRCGETMRSFLIRDSEIDRCFQCGAVWADAGETGTDDAVGTGGSLLGGSLLYALTIPERTLRSAVGLAAGTVKESAAYLVPQAFQNSKTYEVVVANSLKFLAEDVGGVAAEQGEEENSDDYLARKAVGNFVDLAGLATLHVSPLWFMAIVSDIAYGSKTYVRELADELQKQGLIDDASVINHVDDVLEAVQNATGEAAGLFDKPPLSVEELKKTLDNTRTAIQSADYARVIPEAELNKYWSEMKEIADKEGVNMIGLSGGLTMHALGKVSTVSRGALTGIQVVGGLFSKHVIGHYADALTTVRERGFYCTVSESYAPYVDALWSNFKSEKTTLTEELVSGRVFKKAFNAVSGWVGGGKESTTPEPEAADDKPAESEDS